MAKIIDDSYDAQKMDFGGINRLVSELKNHIPERQNFIVLDTRIRRDKTEPMPNWDIWDIDNYEYRLYRDGRLTIRVYGKHERWQGGQNPIKTEDYESESPIDEYSITIFDFKKEDRTVLVEGSRVITGNWTRGQKQLYTDKGEGFQELLKEKLAEAKAKQKKLEADKIKYRENKPDWVGIQQLARETAEKTIPSQDYRGYWVLAQRSYLYRVDNNEYGMNEHQITRYLYCLRANGELFVRTEKEDNVFEANGKPYSLYSEEPAERPFTEKDLLLLDYEPKQDYREFPGKPYYLHRGDTEASDKLLFSEKGGGVKKLLGELPAKEEKIAKTRREHAEALAKRKQEQWELIRKREEQTKLLEEEKQKKAAEIKVQQAKKLKEEEKARNTFTDDWYGYCKKTLKRNFRIDRVKAISSSHRRHRSAKEVKRIINVLKALDSTPNSLINNVINMGDTFLGGASLSYHIARHKGDNGFFEVSVMSVPVAKPNAIPEHLGEMRIVRNTLKIDHVQRIDSAVVPVEALFELFLRIIERLPTKNEYDRGLRYAKTRKEVENRVKATPLTKKEKEVSGEGISIEKFFRALWWTILGLVAGVVAGWFFAAVTSVALHYLGVPAFAGEDIPIDTVIPWFKFCFVAGAAICGFIGFKSALES